MKKKLLLLAFLLLTVVIYLYYFLSTIKITAQFNELEPFRNHLPVYYKGFKLGHTVKVYPSKDYVTTYIDMRIKRNGARLPENISAVLKRKDKKDYVELIYPNAPYLALLKNKTIIDGEVGASLENFLQSQAKNGGLDEIKENVNDTIQSAGETFKALTGMLGVLTGILEEIKPSISNTAKNLEITSENLANISKNIDITIQKGYLENTLQNVEKVSGNFLVSADNFGEFTNNLNKESSILLNSFLKNLNVVISNINLIIVGLGETLQKNLSGLRLIFGKAISIDNKLCK